MTDISRHRAFQLVCSLGGQAYYNIAVGLSSLLSGCMYNKMRF